MTPRYNVSMTRVRFTHIALALLIVVCALPLFARAQESGGQNSAELESTIRAAIMADPRASAMSQTEIDGIVQSLVAGAAAQGVTASDIAPPPADAQTTGFSDGCGAGDWKMFLELIGD